MSKSKTKRVAAQQPQAATPFPTAKPTDPIVASAPASAITSDASPTSIKEKAKKVPKVTKKVKPEPKSKKTEPATGWPFPSNPLVPPHSPVASATGTTNVTPGTEPVSNKPKTVKKLLEQQAKLVKAQEKSNAKAKDQLVTFNPSRTLFKNTEFYAPTDIIAAVKVLEVRLKTGKKAHVLGLPMFKSGQDVYKVEPQNYSLLTLKEFAPMEMAVPASQVRVCERKTRDMLARIRKSMRLSVTLRADDLKSHTLPGGI